MSKALWEFLTANEQDYIKSCGYGAFEVNSHPAVDTADMLWHYYAANGWILGEALRRSHEIRNFEAE